MSDQLDDLILKPLALGVREGQVVRIGADAQLMAMCRCGAQEAGGDQDSEWLHFGGASDLGGCGTPTGAGGGVGAV